MAWNTTGCDVDTAKQTASSILFSRAGSATVRQVEVSETMEVRGLTETAGKGKVPNAANIVDNTVQTAYYAFIDGLVFTITVTSGTKEEWSAARKDESGQWVATKRTTTYAATGLNTNVWGTTPLDSDGQKITLSASGVSRVVSRDKSTSYVFSFNGNTLVSTVETVVTEVRYINSKTNADAIVNANNSASSYTTATCTSIGICSIVVPSGTEKFASARYVSPRDGWSVTITAKTHGHSGPNWS